MRNYTILVASLLLLVSLPVSAKVEISDGSIKALYHLEDTADSSGNAKTLTNVNSVSFNAFKFTNGSDAGTGNTNKKLWYNGTLGYDQSPASIGGWYQLSSDISSGVFEILAHSFGSPSYSALHVDYQYNSGTRRLLFGRQKYGSTDDTCTYNITLGTTAHFFALRWNGTVLTGYVDGSAVCSVASSANGSSAGSTQTFQMYYGEQTSGGYGDGKLDDVFASNVYLATTTLDSIYNSGTGNEICVSVGCATTATTSTSLSTSTDCSIGTDSTDWELIKNLVLWIFYTIFILIIISLLIKFLKKFARYGKP